MSFFDLLRGPDRITVLSESGPCPLAQSSATSPRWTANGVAVTVEPVAETLAVRIRAPLLPLVRVQLRWRLDPSANLLYLGDAWERGYGELAWRSLVAERPLPWYFQVHDGQVTHGYGVRTAPAAWCCWQVDDAGVSLWLEIACGSRGVVLGERELDACTVVTRRGRTGESAAQAATAFARLMCLNPRLPSAPVYGFNDWYYAYGRSSAATILRDAGLVSELCSGANRPFQVIDGGWAKHHEAIGCEGGPWDAGNARFPDLPGLAAAIRGCGARPGIWFRPLLAEEPLPEAWLLPLLRFPHESASPARLLDPTVPEAVARIRADVAGLAAWGYELIKHDFSTYDLCGRWGFQMGFQPTAGQWSFHDRSVTTAEAILALYRALRDGAGAAMLLGCNTVSHLSAGFFEINRTGDDTSGRAWERTRRMGVNTLAFRAHQHGTFYAADADCVGLTALVPWSLNRQWLELLARSGTPLFVSADPEALGSEQREALRQAFTRAAEPASTIEPIDWLLSSCPSYWRTTAESMHYDWYGEQGVDILNPG